MPWVRLQTCPHDVRMGGARFFLGALLLVLQATDLSAAPTDISRQVILIGENTRMSFDEEIVRIAVGDPQIANVQMVSNREILVLGRRAGQTNLLFWFATGRVAERGLRVERDLSLLAVALKSIHPEIEALSAPDQDAVVLRGVVPDVRFSRAAEAVAIDYLRGGALGRAREGALILGADAPSEAASDEPLSIESSEFGRNFLLEDATGGGGGRVVNLIRVDDVPPALEERMRLAVSNSDGVQISIRRLTAGALPDDSRDTFILEGRVRTQVALVRALLSAARMVDDRANAGQIEVVADEGGALSGRSSGGTGGGGASLGGVGTTIGGTGGATGNNLEANIARAKVLSLANGRILSFIEVEELPHVRLETRIYEVNRSRLNAWEPRANILLGNTGKTQLSPSLTSQILQGSDSARSVTPSDVQGALSLLSGGAILGGMQYVGDSIAIDLALSLLEETSIARALAKPTISVLSGELATFSAGGQVPIALTVDTTTSATSGTLLSSTAFADFGVNVSVRPLVDDDDMITLDVAPSISQPDFDLTKELVGATGSQQATTAFQTRSLRTTTRLRDGESFVIGGLLQTTIGRSSSFTPWFHRIPGLGWLGKSLDDQRDELDFVVVLTPSLTHERDPRAALWAYPDADEILEDLMKVKNEESWSEGELGPVGRR
jgi:pilus assembly protein CpaC